jgi:hypothetical protein
MLQSFRRLQRQATREGRGEEFLEAVRQVYRHLRHDPVKWGEPAYRLPAPRMQVYSGVAPPLIVHFAVSEERPLVFIKGLKMLSTKKND